MFRISSAGQEPVVDVDRLDGVAPAIRGQESGRYHIDQIERDPLPSGRTSRRWGNGIKRDDISVAIERDSWEA